MTESKQKTYEVKDTDGKTHYIQADSWEVNGSGLMFYRDEDTVAWFVEWLCWVMR